jgi:hypothetical protein
MYYIRNDSDTICDIPPLSKDGQSEPGSLRGAITIVMTHITSHTRIKQKKYFITILVSKLIIEL